jgi:hypothetical protein
MKQTSTCGAIVLSICITLQSCAQTISKQASAREAFVATTPCDEFSKSLLHIPSGTNAEMMKWNLTLHRDARTSEPTTYELSCAYGMAKQGTRGLMPGAATLELNGRWTIISGTNDDAKAIVYRLTAQNAPIALSFLKPNKNILHLLDRQGKLMVGNGAWSYTLNSSKPVVLSSNAINSPENMSPKIAYDSAVFFARTPCYEPLLALTGKTITGCELIKCKLVLYCDVNTHEPANFRLYTVHVGAGNARYPTSGTWKVTKGTKSDAAAILYQLESNSRTDKPLTFLRASDSILFLVDKEMNCMAGNDYCSYTFNRATK